MQIEKRTLKIIKTKILSAVFYIYIIQLPKQLFFTNYKKKGSLLRLQYRIRNRLSSAVYDPPVTLRHLDLDLDSASASRLVQSILHHSYQLYRLNITLVDSVEVDQSILFRSVIFSV